MTALIIFHLFNALLGLYCLFFSLFTVLISPWLINRKFSDKWKKYVEEKTFQLASDANKYGMYIRTRMYAKAALSEKYSQKTFGMSRNEFRSKLNRFELALCFIAVSLTPAILWCLTYFFTLDKLGYLDFLNDQIQYLPQFWK